MSVLSRYICDAPKVLAFFKLCGPERLRNLCHGLDCSFPLNTS